MSKKEDIEDIYREYFSKIPSDKKKYIKSAQAKLYLDRLLKEFTKEDLLSAVKNYQRKTESTYYMAPQYFFSDSKDMKAKQYRPFIDYIGEVENKKVIKDFDLGF